MSRVAGEAIAFCSRTASFCADELPGRLTGPEQQAIADALEQAGLFQTEVM